MAAAEDVEPERTRRELAPSPHEGHRLALVRGAGKGAHGEAQRLGLLVAVSLEQLKVRLERADEDRHEVRLREHRAGDGLISTDELVEKGLVRKRMNGRVRDGDARRPSPRRHEQTRQRSAAARELAHELVLDERSHAVAEEREAPAKEGRQGVGQVADEDGHRCLGPLLQALLATGELDTEDLDPGAQRRLPLTIDRGAAARIRQAEEPHGRLRLRLPPRDPRGIRRPDQGGRILPRGGLSVRRCSAPWGDEPGRAGSPGSRARRHGASARPTDRCAPRTCRRTAEGAPRPRSPRRSSSPPHREWGACRPCARAPPRSDDRARSQGRWGRSRRDAETSPACA